MVRIISMTCSFECTHCVDYRCMAPRRQILSRTRVVNCLHDALVPHVRFTTEVPSTALVPRGGELDSHTPWCPIEVMAVFAISCHAGRLRQQNYKIADTNQVPPPISKGFKKFKLELLWWFHCKIAAKFTQKLPKKSKSTPK